MRENKGEMRMCGQRVQPLQFYLHYGMLMKLSSGPSLAVCLHSDIVLQNLHKGGILTTID